MVRFLLQKIFRRVTVNVEEERIRERDTIFFVFYCILQRFN